MTNKPIVLVLDDEPRKVALNLERDDISIRAISPEELREDHLRDAHLVLVDHVLEHWSPTPEPPYACRPADGLALAGIVRAHMRSSIAHLRPWLCTLETSRRSQSKIRRNTSSQWLMGWNGPSRRELQSLTCKLAPLHRRCLRYRAIGSPTTPSCLWNA